MKDLNDIQQRMLDACEKAAPAPLPVWGYSMAPDFTLATARALERRGLVEVGSTSWKHPTKGRGFVVSLTDAGRLRAAS